MTIRKFIPLFCFFMLLIFTACKTKLTQFDIDYNAALQRPVKTGELVTFSTEEMKTDCRIKFERNDTKRSKVKRIYLKGLEFFASSEKSEMYLVKNLKNIYISSPSYPEQKISFKKLNSSNPADQLSVEVEGSTLDVIDFIKQDRFSMRFDFENTKDFPESIQMYVNITFFVEGELIKTNLYHKILV